MQGGCSLHASHGDQESVSFYSLHEYAPSDVLAGEVDIGGIGGASHGRKLGAEKRWGSFGLTF